MPAHADPDRLRSLKTLPQLIAYLRDDSRIAPLLLGVLALTAVLGVLSLNLQMWIVAARRGG